MVRQVFHTWQAASCVRADARQKDVRQVFEVDLVLCCKALEALSDIEQVPALAMWQPSDEADLMAGQQLFSRSWGWLLSSTLDIKGLLLASSYQRRGALNVLHLQYQCQVPRSAGTSEFTSSYLRCTAVLNSMNHLR